MLAWKEDVPVSSQTPSFPPRQGRGTSPQLGQLNEVWQEVHSFEKHAHNDSYLNYPGDKKS